MTDFEKLGEPTLRAIIDTFVDRCFADMMIGFHFQRADKARVKRFEYQHAAHFFGADVAYEGRPIDQAHRAHAILGGQFMRRRQILITTAREQGMPEEMVERWAAYQDTLRPQVTSQVGSGCQD